MKGIRFVPNMEDANVVKRVLVQSVLVILDGTAMIVLVPLSRMNARTNAPTKYAWDMEHANVTMVNDANVMKGTMENIANVNRVITTTANHFCHVSSKRLTECTNHQLTSLSTLNNATELPNLMDKSFLVPTSRLLATSRIWSMSNLMELSS